MVNDKPTWHKIKHQTYNHNNINQIGKIKKSMPAFTNFRRKSLNIKKTE